MTDLETVCKLCGKQKWEHPGTTRGGWNQHQEVQSWFSKRAAAGGSTAAANMTPEQRRKRATKASKAAAKARAITPYRTKLTKQQRSERARKAVAVRWAKAKREGLPPFAKVARKDVQ